MLYATRNDWYEWADPPRDVTDRQLSAASRQVGNAARCARYAVDPAGAPADPAVAAAFREATLLQLDATIAADTAAEAQSGQLAGVKAASIDGASYTLAGPGEIRAAHIDPVTGIAPEAWDVLAAAGLLDVVPTVWG